MKKSLLAAALIAPFLTGCVIAVSDGEAETHWAGKNSSSWETKNKNNREAISELAMDSSYQSVLTKLKTPDFTELLKKGDDVYQILFYVTHSVHSDGKTTKDECTPLIFKNDKLVGMGESALGMINN